MTTHLEFAKMQGVGNDFVVIDGRKLGYLDWSALAIEICERKFGVGSDGLLIVDQTQLGDVMMRMYNPDGTPDVCGNGLRCVARYSVERGIVHGDIVRIGTLAGVRTAKVVRDSSGRISTITVSMGQPKFDAASIPMELPRERVLDYQLELENGDLLSVAALSTGSTHCVTFVPELPGDEQFLQISPQVELHPLFPERTSLMWCKIEGSSRLNIRIWERGAGETLGCGTGACAAAVAAIALGFAPPELPVLVASRGGELSITWAPNEEIQMTGPAAFVYEGVYPLYPERTAAGGAI